MNDEDSLGSGKFMTLFDSINFIFLINLCFIITTLPFSVYVVFFKYIDLKILSLLWIICGPALTATFLSLNKLLEKSDVSAIKTFFNAYLKNFKQSFLISAVQGIIFFILQVDMQFFLAKKIYVLYYMFIAFSILLILITFFIYPILSKFEISTINLIKLSAFYFIKKIHILILNLVIFVVISYILSRIQVICLFFDIGIVSLLVLINEKNIFAEIEDTFLNNRELS